jgi:hypothetical protein
MRSILCFRSLLSDACLEELLLEGLVNRYTVLALQFSDLSSPATLVKCRTLIEQIPVSQISTQKKKQLVNQPSSRIGCPQFAQLLTSHLR